MNRAHHRAVWVIVGIVALAGIGCGGDEPQAKQPAGPGKPAPPGPITNLPGPGDLPPKPETQPTPVVELPVKFRLVKSLPIPMDEPTGIALDKQGRLFVVGSGGVEVFDADGTPVRGWPTTTPATCVAIDDEGAVYVGEATQIEKFTATGSLLKRWGTKGTEPGQFGLVTGICTIEANVFVADAGNRRIHRFASNGDHISTFGEKDLETGAEGIVIYKRPHLDCAAGPDGSLYVNNPGRLWVEQYDINGNFKSKWGRSGTRPGRFPGCCNPTNLTVDPKGRIITSDQDIPRVSLYGPDGTLLGMVAAEIFPKKTEGIDVATDAEGRVYVVDSIAKQVHVFAEEN